MSHDRFTSVWDALEDTPQEAENLRLRSALMMAVIDHLIQAGLTQAQAAKQLGVHPTARVRSPARQDPPV